MDAWTSRMGMEFDVSVAVPAYGYLHCGDQHLDPLGLVHPGVIQTLVDETARRGACASTGVTMVTVSNTTTILQRVGTGRLEAVASPTHVDKRQYLWRTEVKCADDGEGVAFGTVRLEPWAGAEPPLLAEEF